MKKIYLFIVLVSLSVSTIAQTLNVVVGDVTYAFPAGEAGEMVYSDGQTLSITNCVYKLEEIGRIYVDDTPTESNTVLVTYDNERAKVMVAGNIARYVSVTVADAHVSIVQDELVGEETCGEITYILKGTSADGSFGLSGQYKSEVRLDGLSLIHPSGAAIDIQNGKRINLRLADGTQNMLADGAGGSQKGCLVCKGHLEFKGTGALDIYGNASHAIFAKEYVKVKEASLTVHKAIKDGLNCNQYFLMESGVLDISNVGDDGLQVSFKDDADREAEDTGAVVVNGGKIMCIVTAPAAKAIKADGNITVAAGELELSTTGGGQWDTDGQKTKAASCMSSDANIAIDGGMLTLKSTGSGGKGISCDSTLTVNGGNISVMTSGGLYAYVNGTEYPSYTGNSDNLNTQQKSSPKGIKADGDVTINGGNISVTVTGNGGEGIESKAIMTVNDGNITVDSYDDGLNSSSHLYIKGGNITSVATNNDAIDSNGNLYISGGTTLAFGGSQPETGIDANTERGYSVFFTGGTVLAVGGGSNSAPSSSQSTQCYVTASGTVTANSVISLSDGATTLASFTVPTNYTSSSSSGDWGSGRPGPGGNQGSGGILITCGGLTKGSSYVLSNGSSTSTVTANQQGSSSWPR